MDFQFVGLRNTDDFFLRTDMKGDGIFNLFAEQRDDWELRSEKAEFDSGKTTLKTAEMSNIAAKMKEAKIFLFVCYYSYAGLMWFSVLSFTSLASH